MNVPPSFQGCLKSTARHFNKVRIVWPKCLINFVLQTPKWKFEAPVNTASVPECNCPHHIHRIDALGWLAGELVSITSQGQQPSWSCKSRRRSQQPPGRSPVVFAVISGLEVMYRHLGHHMCFSVGSLSNDTGHKPLRRAPSMWIHRVSNGNGSKPKVPFY